MKNLRLVALTFLFLSVILSLAAQSDSAPSGYIYTCQDIYLGFRAARSVFLCADQSVVVISEFEVDDCGLHPGYLMTRLDPEGNLLWETQLHFGYYTTVALVDVDADGNIYYISTEPEEIRLYKKTDSGTTGVGGPITPPAATYFNKALRTGEGDIVAIGRRGSNHDPQWAACYYRFSAQGDTLAAAYWPGSCGAEAYDLALLDNGNLLIVCYLNGDTHSLLEVSPDGEIISTYDVPMSFDHSATISREPNAQSCLIAYTTDDNVSIDRFDGNGLEYLFTVPNSVIGKVCSMVVTANNIFLCGKRGFYEGVLVKLDPAGEVEWAWYQPGDNNTFCQQWASESKLLLAVDHTGCAYWSWGGVTSQQVIVKLLPNGQVANQDEVQVPAANLLTAYPNPMKSHLAIKTDPSLRDDSVNIYNIRGELIHRLKLSDGETLWDGKDSSGHDCPSGIYLLKSNNEKSQVKKISKVN